MEGEFPGKNSKGVNYKERLFFGDSRRKTEVLFGVSSIAELISREEITLPDGVFQPAYQAVEETEKDFHERLIIFDLDQQ